MKKYLIIALLLLVLFAGYVFARQYLSGFGIAEINESDPVVSYFGFTSTRGETDWYIMRSSEAVTGVTEYRYVTGDANFDIYWSSRTFLNYQKYEDIYNVPPLN
jgi:hypothetical protein